MVIPQILRGKAKFRLPWSRRAEPVINIPIAFGTSRDFTSKVAELLSKPTTYVYIDTSFLMWLTKIGAASRGEFFGWLEIACPGRVCVPVWTAHEYLRHHISSTIVTELELRIKELAEVAGKTYGYLRPFMDEPLRDGVDTREAQQGVARKALNELQLLAEDAKQWRARYAAHSKEVISFINGHVPSRTEVFDMFDELAAVGQGRFDGRIPPGFQDRSKQEKRGTEVEDGEAIQTTMGSNRWGDLVFWKEVLGLAKHQRAKTIVLLTNDLKNDWQFGGRAQPDEADLKLLKKKWRPVPLAHPMLCLEAKVQAEVDDVLLLDSVYLGVFFKRHAEASTASFVDVAIVPDPPQMVPERQVRSNARRAAREAADLDSATVPPPPEAGKFPDSAFLFDDGAHLLLSEPVLLRAWRASKDLESERMTAVLATIATAILDGDSIVDTFATGGVAELNNGELVALARSMHDHSQSGQVGSPEEIIDLLSMLERCPPKTAASLYMGILGSMYFVEGTNEPRRPPSSLCVGPIFEASTRPYAALPNKVLRGLLAKRDKRPAFVPGQPITIGVEITHQPDADGQFILGSILLDGTEVYSDAQSNDLYNFSVLSHGKEQMTVQEILDLTCSSFAIASTAISYDGDVNTIFKIVPTAGFRLPSTINFNKEAQ